MVSHIVNKKTYDKTEILWAYRIISIHTMILGKMFRLALYILFPEIVIIINSSVDIKLCYMHKILCSSGIKTHELHRIILKTCVYQNKSKSKENIFYDLCEILD